MNRFGGLCAATPAASATTSMARMPRRWRYDVKLRVGFIGSSLDPVLACIGMRQAMPRGAPCQPRITTKATKITRDYEARKSDSDFVCFVIFVVKNARELTGGFARRRPSSRSRSHPFPPTADRSTGASSSRMRSGRRCSGAIDRKRSGSARSPVNRGSRRGDARPRGRPGIGCL